MTALTDALRIVMQDDTLSAQQMAEAVAVMMDGTASADDMAAFLTRLAKRGETVAEITGAARVLRDRAGMITAPDDALDCCGTGGDGIGTYNISTAVALVVAACGVPVAKHGNRAASSRSGAADVLEALGVPLDVPHETLERALKETSFCFLMAPRHHAAMKHIAPVRKQLGFRTIFNLLGPLANPAGTRRQLIGVYDRKWLVPIAETLARLGTQRAWVVHGHDGLDEITTTGPTAIAMLDEDGSIMERTLEPDDFGLPASDPQHLLGGDAQENATALRALLDGEFSAYRDIVLANSAAVLKIHGFDGPLPVAVTAAAQAIDNGKALAVLHRYIEVVS